MGFGVQGFRGLGFRVQGVGGLLKGSWELEIRVISKVTTLIITYKPN